MSDTLHPGGGWGRIPIVAAAAVAVCAALAGCSVVRGPIAEPTAAELDDMLQQVNDIQWQNLQFSPDSPRPTVRFERFVQPGEASDVYAVCMVENGFPEWEESSFNALGGPPTVERLAIYSCVTRFPIHPGFYGIRTPEQLDAVYDYYRDSLVPCLRGAGVVIGPAPLRDDFVRSSLFGMWNPYAQNLDVPESALGGVYTRCGDLSYQIGMPDR